MITIWFHFVLLLPTFNNNNGSNYGGPFLLIKLQASRAVLMLVFQENPASFAADYLDQVCLSNRELQL